MFFPKPILAAIFSLLDIKSLARCERSSSLFYHITQEERSIWTMVYSNTWKNTQLEKMDESLNWKEQTRIRSQLEVLCVMCPQKLNHHFQDLIQLSETDGMLKKLEMLLQSESLPHLRDVLKIKNVFKEDRIPDWLAENTYFHPSSSHSFFEGFVIEEHCKLRWNLYGRGGEKIEFMFDYSCCGVPDLCHPIASISFKTECKQCNGLYMLIQVTSEEDNDTSEKDAFKIFNRLKELIADDNFTPNLLFRYVAACSTFRQVLRIGKSSKNFFYDLASREYVSFWPSIYYKEDAEEVLVLNPPICHPKQIAT